MPVLSFPCTLVPRDASEKRTPFQQWWIKGFDLRELALAATKLLKSVPNECGYALYAKTAEDTKAATAQVYLEVVRTNPHISAIVGPMAGPQPPAILSAERCYTLEELVAHVQIADGSDAEGAYAVIVKHAGIFTNAAYVPPHRKKGESDEAYQKRAEPIEQSRRELAQHEGIHTIHYDVPPDLWRARDLDMLMALLYRLLPTHEPRWREVGAVTQETFAGEYTGREPAYQYCLQVARGEYIAHLRLPHFPTSALADWLRTRKCDINLCHPVVSVEAMSRTAATPSKPAEARDAHTQRSKVSQAGVLLALTPVAS